MIVWSPHCVGVAPEESITSTASRAIAVGIVVFNTRQHVRKYMIMFLKYRSLGLLVALSITNPLYKVTFRRPLCVHAPCKTADPPVDTTCTISLVRSLQSPFVTIISFPDAPVKHKFQRIDNAACHESELIAPITTTASRRRINPTVYCFQYLSKFLDFRKSSRSFAFLRILSRYLKRKTV